jgi:hypothetical protein
MATRNKKLKPAAIRETREYSAGEMADFLVGNVPELRESFTRADIELALDDRGWLVPGRQFASADLDPQTRTTLVAKARLYWLRDPLMKQSVRLWTDYALGSGISWDSKDAKIKKRLDEFANGRRNKSIMNSEGQRRSSKKLLVDGELFFAVFDEDNGETMKTIRRIDCLQVTDLITDPDDEEHVLGYRRLTAQDKVLYYADWRNDDTDDAMLAAQPDPASKGLIGTKVESGAKVYHAPFDTLHKRGNGLLSSNLDWSKEHRRFMEARVAIQQALAKFAWKAKVKGGQGMVDALTAKLQSTYATSGMSGQRERHPQPAPASTWVENAGVDLAPMPRATGAGDARSDGDQLKLMVAAGTGIMLHYFGDPSTGNLATSTAMELPMLKMFASYQTYWRDAYRDLFAIALDEDPAKPAQIDLTLPPILLDDLRKIGQFVKDCATVFPEIHVPSVLRSMLNSFNVANIDDVMDEVENKRGELEVADQQDKAHQLALAQAQKPNPNQPEPAGAPANPPKPTSEAERQTRALDRLAAALEEVNRPSEPAIRESAPPMNLNITLDQNHGKVTKSGTVRRDPATGAMKFEVEEAVATN